MSAGPIAATAAASIRAAAGSTRAAAGRHRAAAAAGRRRAAAASSPCSHTGTDRVTPATDTGRIPRAARATAAAERKDDWQRHAAGAAEVDEVLLHQVDEKRPVQCRDVFTCSWEPWRSRWSPGRQEQQNSSSEAPHTAALATLAASGAGLLLC